VQSDEIEKPEKHYAVPFSMTLYRKINRTHFFNKINPGKEKYSTDNIEIYEGKPGIEE
jgi:hypothetical protein